jgi:hypothetical protein
LIHLRKSDRRERIAHKIESVPSDGWREVAHALHAPEAHVADAGAPADDREHLEDMNIAEGELSPAEVAG